MPLQMFANSSYYFTFQSDGYMVKNGLQNWFSVQKVSQKWCHGQSKLSETGFKKRGGKSKNNSKA